MVWMFRKVLDLVMGVAALAAVLLCAFLALNGLFGFGVEETLVTKLLEIRNWVFFAVVLLAGLRFCTGKGVILFVVYLLLAAAAVVWFCFPEAAQSLSGLIGG